MSLYAELKRRSVFRVAIGYIGISWLIIQVIETLFGIYEIDDSIAQVIVNVLAVGFVPAMVLAWVFELTPEGIRRDENTDKNTPAMRDLGRRVDRVIIAILSAAVIFFAVDKFWPRGIPGPSIAVMPFTTSGLDAEQDAFAAGMTNQMRSMLNSVRELRVIADYSVSALIDEGADRNTMATELRLTHFLEGSVQTIGNEVRVTAALINVKEGTQDWSATFDRDMGDIFAIQDEIASEVIAQLSFAGRSPVSPVSAKVDIEAYKLYLRASHIMEVGQKGVSVIESLETAISLLERAVAIEPGYVDAWLELSLASFWLSRQLGETQGTTMLELADEALNRAEQLDPDHPVVLAYTAGGEFIDGVGDTQSIASRIEQAIETAPTDPDVVRSTREFLISIGRVDVALAVAELAVDRDPKCPQCWYVLSQILRDAGRSKEAEAAGEVALSLGMNLEFSIAKTQLYQHNPGGMLKLFDSDTPDDPHSLSAYAMALYTADRRDEFERFFTELREVWGDEEPLEVAMVYAWSGDADEAFVSLQQTIEQRASVLQRNYRSPFFFNLHGDPRWQEVLRRIGRHPEQLAKIEFDPMIPAP